MGSRVELPLDFGERVVSEPLGVRQQNSGRCGPMFRLAKQVGGADLAVDGVVGDDERLGWASEQVDADPTVQLPLGLRHESIARPNNHVDGRDGFRAKRHRSHRLHAAEHVDLVGASEVHGGHDRRMRLCAERRRAGYDFFTPATLAVTTLICADATIGYLPPGT